MLLPEVKRDWALFLDLDGTLLDVASTPDGVAAPSALSETLERVHERLGGALAVVSGRPLSEIDRLLSPSRLTAAGEHGAVIRYPSGAIDKVPDSFRPPQEWVFMLREAMVGWNGILVEEKGYSVAVHFRLAPERERQVYDLLAKLISTEPAGYELLAAKMAYEIRSKSVTKARAVKAFMEVDPFRRRVPVFVGDDVTDTHGMDLARRLGGFGLQVEDMFAGKPSAVRDWLRRAANSLPTDG